MSRRIEGRWTLHAKREPDQPVVIRVYKNFDGKTEPQWWEHEQALTLVWPDGSRKVYPWAALDSASYSPPLDASSPYKRPRSGAAE